MERRTIVIIIQGFSVINIMDQPSAPTFMVGLMEALTDITEDPIAITEALTAITEAIMEVSTVIGPFLDTSTIIMLAQATASTRKDLTSIVECTPNITDRAITAETTTKDRINVLTPRSPITAKDRSADILAAARQLKINMSSQNNKSSLNEHLHILTSYHRP